METNEAASAAQSKRPWVRWGIDALVVVTAAVVFWPQVQSFLPEYLFYEFDDYIDTVTPDEVLLIDERVNVLLNRMRLGEVPGGDFQTLYENPEPLATYSFTYGVQSGALSPQENYARSVASVVYITTEDTDGLYFGSGTILTEDGVILTNYHNISGSLRVVVATSDGELYPVTRVIAVDENIDIAFLKIDAEGLRPIPLGDSDDVAIGDTTLVIGHPEAFVNSLSLGNVSGIRSYERTGEGTQIQVTNPISGGNSGGALLNARGELIGVPQASIEYEDNIVQVQNINLAVPINAALEILTR